MSNESNPHLRRYYYELKKNGHPVATVCIIEGHPDNGHEGMYFRGMSICSLDDNFDRKRGRFIARNRALRAMKGRAWADSEITEAKALDVISGAFFPDGCEYPSLVNCAVKPKCSSSAVNGLYKWERRFMCSEDRRIKERRLTRKAAADNAVLDRLRVHPQRTKESAEQAK